MAAAPRLGTVRGAALLQEIRVMARRVADSTGEPQIIPVLVGSALREIVDSPLVALYEKVVLAKSAAAARQLKAADEQWAQKTVPGSALWWSGRTWHRCCATMVSRPATCRR